jgi:hypothetical protein
MKSRGNATRASRVIASAIHGASSAESAAIAAHTIVMISVCALDLYWYPTQLPLWAAFGILGMLGVIVLTIADDARLEHAARMAHRQARSGRIVTHSRAVQRALSGYVELHRDLASTRPFNGWFAAHRRLSLHLWLLEACALAHCLDRVASDPQLAAALGGYTRFTQTDRSVGRQADLVLDTASALQVIAASPHASGRAKHRWAHLDRAFSDAMGGMETSVLTLRDMPTANDFNVQRARMAQLRAVLLRHARAVGVRLTPDVLAKPEPAQRLRKGSA